MKISGNFPIKYIKNNYQKNSPIQNSNRAIGNSDSINISNPALYQAYNNISFSGGSLFDEIPSVNYISCLRESRRREDEIIFSYTDSQGIRQKSIIPPRTVTNLLKDENDEVEKKWLDIYVGLYTLKRNELFDAAKDSDAFIQEQADKIRESNGKKIQGFKTAQQLKTEGLLLQKAQNQVINQNDFDMKATLFATVAVRLLRGDESQDISKFDEKLVLAKKLSTFNENFNNAKATEMIVNISKNENGKIDLPFCTKLTDLLLNNGILPKGDEQEFINYSASILRNILASSDDSDLAYDCAQDLLSEGFLINHEYKIFETVFDLCLNPINKRFDITAFERLLSASECYEENITSQMEFESAQEYDENEKERKMFIFSYMSEIVDMQTGKIKEGAMTPEEFFEKYFEEE